MATEEQRHRAALSGGKSQPTDMQTGTGASPLVNGLQFIDPQSRSEVRTVQFNVTPPDGGLGVFVCEAIINWQNLGNSISRRVTVGNGTTISGTAEGVSVSLQDVTTFAPAGRQYKVTTSVSGGVRPTAQQPILIGYRNGAHTIVPGATDVLPIPTDAGATSAYVNVLPLAVDGFTKAGNLVAIVRDNAGRILTGFMPTIQNGFVPLPPGAISIELTNLDATFSYDAQITFGIDG